MAFKGLQISGDAANNYGIHENHEIRSIVSEAFASGEAVTIPAGRTILVIYDDAVETARIIAALDKLKAAFLNLDG